MKLDAETLEDGINLSADVCVVGSGIAGTACAFELKRQGFRVIVLEAGGISPSPEVQKEYAGFVSSDRHPDLTLYRERVVGGTSSVWGGRSRPFDDVDYDGLTAGGNKWPIDRTRLNTAIEKACVFLELGESTFTADPSLPPESRVFMSGAHCSNFVADSIWRFSPPTSLRKPLLAESAADERLTLLFNAPCLGMTIDGFGQPVRVANFALGRTGRKGSVSASMFVLACGTLETTRLLLASKDRDFVSCGDHSGLLGRYYMTHHYGVAGKLQAPKGDFVQWGYVRTRDGIYARHLVRPSSEAVVRHGLLNLALGIDNPDFADPSHGNAVLSAMFFAKAIMGKKIPVELLRLNMGKGKGGNTGAVYREHAINILLGVHSVAAFGVDWARRRILASRKLPSVALRSSASNYRLIYASEQSPCYESRVTLSQELDKFGLPKLHVDWHYNLSDVDAIMRGINLFKQDVAGSGYELELIPDLMSSIEEQFGVGSHQIGTARMSNEPAGGVVGPDCAVHGYANLFVGSAAVFPSSGYANPTLMIAAIGYHIAGICGERLKSSRAFGV